MNAGPWRVLVADDDPTAALLMRAALAGGDFLPTIVERGDLAWEAFCQAPFDLALLDVEMPGMDGFEVIAAIRASRGGGLPVVLVSGRADPEFFERAQALAAAVIAKPVDWSSLADRLRALLQAAGA